MNKNLNIINLTLKSSSDSSEEEEIIEESANEEKEMEEKEELEMDMENHFYNGVEKHHRKGYYQGIRLNLHRTRIIDDVLEIQRINIDNEKEQIKEHIRELLLKKKNPSRTLDLYKLPDNS